MTCIFQNSNIYGSKGSNTQSKHIFYQNMTLKDCLGLNISLNKNVYQNARASICQNINHKLDQNVTQKQDKVCLSKYEPNKNDTCPKYIKFLSSEEKKVKIHQQTILFDIFNTLLQVKICTQFRLKCSLKLGQKRVSHLIDGLYSTNYQYCHCKFIACMVLSY